MIPVVRTIPDIRTEAGQLNLRYERQEPSAIKIFRKVRKRAHQCWPSTFN